jgi:hypothetical protein
VRINNLTLPDGYETGTTLVMETVYNKTFLPILEGALRSKLIKKDPGSPRTPRDSSNSEKNDNRPNNIIARFYSTTHECTHKYPPHHNHRPPSSSSSSSQPGKKMFQYPIYEDLTKDNFNLLQARLKDGRTIGTYTTSLLVTPLPTRRLPSHTTQWTKNSC